MMAQPRDLAAVEPDVLGNSARDIMIVGLDQKTMQTLNHDGSNGAPYVNHLRGHSELYLVIPIREWDDL